MSYPNSFDQTLGQCTAKEALRVQINRARRRNESLPHLLLTGSPGLGKSMLARVVAAELGVTFRKVAPGAPFPRLTPGQANIVAKAASRNPRQIRAILRMLEALAGERGDPATFRASEYDVDGALRLLGLSRDGLDRRARTYLAELLLGYGGDAGQATMQAHLGEPHLDETEALLIGKGLLRRTRAGRELTRDGRRRAAGSSPARAGTSKPRHDHRRAHYRARVAGAANAR